MKNRIQNILSASKKKKGILLCTAVLVFALLVSAFVAFPQIGQVFAKEYVPPYPEINTFQNEVAETLETLEDIWDEYQVYESDEINYIDDHMKMRYGKVEHIDRENPEKNE